MTLTTEVAKKIIRKLIHGQDYRIEVVTLIDAAFLQYVLDFFKRVVEAKLRNHDISIDWYKKEFLNKNLSPREIGIHSGLNKKTIHNMFNSSTKEIVIDASFSHYDTLYESIKNLIEKDKSVDLTLTIKLNKVSVDLNINESLIVINTIAVKRSELRGALWSTAGKRVEKNLMITLCELFEVPEENYAIKIKGKTLTKEEFEREIDFYLIQGSKQFKCEVKLMGKGNPESADSVVARGSRVFIADKLSETNKKQLNSRKVEWVELRALHGFERFEKVLTNLGIPHRESGVMNKLENILAGLN